MNITNLIKDNKVWFLEYRKGFLYYCIASKSDQGEYYKFPVPISDIGDATFPREEKAIFFMRYINRAIEENTFVKK